MAENRIIILKRANKLFRQGKADAAIKEYKKVLAIKADDLEVRRIIGDLELRQNSIPGAIEQFEWIADYYLNEGFFAKAIAMYKRITRVDPNYEGALFKLADLYTKQGLIMEAKQIYLDVAEECKRQNNQKKALDMYRKILEFDRTNIKMRLLLADNYLKEGLETNAINEYLTAADILISKKDFRRAEELLLGTIRNIKHVKLIEKLIYFYTKQEEDDKAITLLQELGLDVFKNVDLLKVLGELYLKKNQISEAEIVFSKIAELDPEETEVILRLGKVYLQREEYEKTYKLFLPIIDKNLQNQKYEEAASLLRLIIASNNTYLPALTKLASIFKLTGKTNNLIAMYESLIPVYEQKEMKTELRRTLEELIKLSDTPFSYEEQLAKLDGKQVKEEVEEENEKENDREKEFINYNLRIVNEAIKVSDFNKAIDILKKSKVTFPKNLEIRKKMFEVYQEMDQVEMAVEEGKGLLELYKFLNYDDEFTELLEKLNQLKPEDVKLVELSGEEKTSIEIDFDRAALEEEISDHHMDDEVLDENDILVLSEDENVTEYPIQMERKKEESTKSLSSVLSEVDFYLNDGYLGDAEKLIVQLKEKYPGNEALLAKIKKLEKARNEARQKSKSGTITSGYDFELEGPAGEGMRVEKKGKTERIDSDGFLNYQGQDSNIEIDFGDIEAPNSLKLMDSGSQQSSPMFLDMEEKLDVKKPAKPLDDDMMFELELPRSQEPQYKKESEKSHPEWEDSSLLKISEEAYAHTDNVSVGQDEDEPLQLSEEDSLRFEEDESAPFGDNENLFEIESSISQESSQVQEYEDSKVEIKNIDTLMKPTDGKIKRGSAPKEDELAFEIEFEGPEDTGDMPMMEIDKDTLIQSPSSRPDREKTSEGYTSSALDEIDLDSIMMDEESPYELDSPFKETSGSEMAFDSDEDLVEENLFVEEAYLEIEKNSREELEAIATWVKELEKQRTSTIEKNMMEIFEEFKKGVDEKIGQEDYDTRYNLGIAYKEMGLLEEAIHEFLISSKHPLKFFDSAGLLGMCFREKGMFSEAESWFEKALETPGRRKEEYLAVKYEMVVTLKLKEDYKLALKLLEEIIRVTPDYRNVVQLYQEVKALNR